MHSSAVVLAPFGLASLVGSARMTIFSFGAGMKGTGDSFQFGYVYIAYLTVAQLCLYSYASVRSPV